MTVSNLFRAGRNSGLSHEGITAIVRDLRHYSLTLSIYSNASSAGTPSIPGNVVVTGGGRARLAGPLVGDRVPEASAQAPLAMNRDHRKYSFLFLSTD